MTSRRHSFLIGFLLLTIVGFSGLRVFSQGARPVNRPPIANAGPDQTAPAASTVTLNGAGSTDADGDPLTYTWILVSRPAGSLATLENRTDVRPSFRIDVPGSYVVRLVVNDGSVNSDPDTVTISRTNSQPAAEAGRDETTAVGKTVRLDGSGSSDADGNRLQFAWSFESRPAGSAAVLSNPAGVAPTFVPDLPGRYIVQLIVHDGSAASVPDSVTISTTNSAPVAEAGRDQSVSPGSLVSLNGSASTDVDGDSLTYAWSFVSRPAGSIASLSDAAAVLPTFTADKPGTYVVQLIVHDGVIAGPQTRSSPPLAIRRPWPTPGSASLPLWEDWYCWMARRPSTPMATR